MRIGCGNDAEAVRAQYAAPGGLAARISFHEKYSVNRQGYGNWIVSHYDIREGMRVLEVGCGTGGMWAGRGDLTAKCGRLVLTDLSTGMLAAAREALGDGNGVEYARADAQELPFPDGSFDAVIANSMLYHVPDPAKAIREARRVLGDGGTFYCATLGENNFAERLAEWFRLGGESFHPNHVFTMQNGEEQLRAAFSDVEAFFYEDALRVTDTEDLVGYLKSLASLRAAADLPGETIRGILRAHEDGGAIDLPKEYGMFIARGRAGAAPARDPGRNGR